MKKKLAIGIGVVVVVIVLALLILPFLVNAERFRPTIESQARLALGRNVQIGKLSMSLMSGGISAEGLTIADDLAFSQAPFLTAKSLDVNVELWPLLTSHELHINSLSLKEPQLALISNAAGQWNFASLGASGARNATHPGAAAGGNFSIARIDISQGRVTVSTIPAAVPPATYSDVDITVKNVTPTSQMPFTLKATAPRGGDLKLEGTAGPLNPNDSSATPFTLTLDAGKVEVAGLSPSTGMAGLLDLAAKLNSDGKLLQSDGKGSLKDFKAAANGVPAKQDLAFSYNASYDLQHKNGNLTANVNAGKDTAKLEGAYDMRGAVTTVRMNLNAPAFSINDLQSLLPSFGVTLPKGTSLQGGTLTLDLQLEGPLDKLVITGPVKLANTRLTGFDLSKNMSSVTSLLGIKSSNDTTIQSFSSNVRVSPEATRADAVNLVLPALGTVTGAGTIAHQNLNFNMIAKVQSTGTGLFASAGTKNIPFTITGTTSDPKITPDVASVAQQAIMDRLQNKNKGATSQDAGGILGGLLGGKKKPK